MLEITIQGIEGLEDILERLNEMPMTRKYGKGLVARLPAVNTDKPASLYMRVSGPKQATKGKGSLPEQFRSTWEEILHRGGQVTSIYVDVCTASNRNRWAFSVLLEDIKAGKTDLIGCWHSSRLVRTQLAAGELEEAFEILGHPVEMFAVIDVLNADILGILAWAGRWERKAIRERTLMGRQTSVSLNHPPSSTPPFWIQLTRDDNDNAIYTLKPVAEWVKWIAEAYASGMRNADIVRRLNLNKVPRATGQTKYGWTRSYVVQVLRYSALKGKWGPFWDQYIDVPALIDEATWETIQERLKENGRHSGRPAKHFVALRGFLWCAECGTKMHAHARDWDYVYHTQKDGTKKRYRSQKGQLKVKYLCTAQQQYGYKCRRPEYVLGKILFPRVWEKLCEALTHRTLLLAGMESRLCALEESDEGDELRRIETRLSKIHQRELSFAEQRADGTISKEIHAELSLRLREERKELQQEQRRLSERVTRIKEAREQLDAAQLLVEALPQILLDVPRQEQEQLVMILINRIDVDKDNQVTITLYLDPDVIRSLPKVQSDSSLPPGLQPSDDFPPELSGMTTESAAVLIGQKASAVRCRRKTGCRRG